MFVSFISNSGNARLNRLDIFLFNSILFSNILNVFKPHKVFIGINGSFTT